MQFQPLLALTGVLAASLVSANDNKTTLPTNLGPYQVSATQYELHTNRTDTLSPTPEKRKLMLIVYNPLKGESKCQKPVISPYMTPATLAYWNAYAAEAGLPNNTLDPLQVESCEQPAVEIGGCDEFPLVLFSPGSGGTRFLYQALTQGLASQGYTVISIEHTYDAYITEFLDGSVVYRNTSFDNNGSTQALIDEEVTPFMDARLGDVFSVLDAAESGQLPGISNFNGTAAMYGHSLGGDLAADAIQHDKRIIGGIDLDGAVQPATVRDTPIHVPFGMFCSYVGWSQDAPEHLNWTWNTFWDNLDEWKVELCVNHTVHNSYTDAPLIADTLGLTRTPLAQQELTGTIAGKTMHAIQVNYVKSFMDFVFKGTKPTLLEGPNAQYPDVFFVRQSEQTKR